VREIQIGVIGIDLEILPGVFHGVMFRDETAFGFVEDRNVPHFFGQRFKGSDVVVGLPSIQIQEENARGAALAFGTQTKTQRDDQRVQDVADSWAVGDCGEEHRSHGGVCYLREQPSKVLAVLKEVEVLYFLIFRLSLQAIGDDIAVILFEGEPPLQQLVALLSVLQPEYIFDELPGLPALLFEILQDVREQLEILLFGLCELFQEGVHVVVQDDKLVGFGQRLSFWLELGVVVLVVGGGELVEEVLNRLREGSDLFDEMAVVGLFGGHPPGLVLGRVLVIRRVGVIEHDAGGAPPGIVEPNYRQNYLNLLKSFWYSPKVSN
jgi:hypothetical protein